MDANKKQVNMKTLKQSWLEWKTIGKYRHPFYQAYLYWSDRYKAWWKSKAMKRAVKLADERCSAERQNIYVLPDENGDPRAFSSSEIKLMKKARVMSRKATCYDLFKESLYIAQLKNVKK